MNTPNSSPTPRASLRWAAAHFARAFYCLILLALACQSAFGVERFPPPEFEPTYQMPVPTLPTPRSNALESVDVAVLLGTLSLATWFVLKKRSRKWILALGIFSLAYFGFYRKGCVCAIGSIQDVALAMSDKGYAVPLTIVAFFLLPLIFALFFGRTFCAAVCPQGAIQDLVLLKPLKLPPWLENSLRLVPFIYLGAAVLFAVTGSAFIICEWDPFVALFRRTGSAHMLAMGGIFLVLGAFIGRPYCRFLCPYGALLSCFSRFSKWHVTLSPNDCIQCGLCDSACPYGAIAEPAQAEIKPGKSKLVAALVLLPVVLALGAWIGGQLSVPLSQVHPTVRLAEWVAADDAGLLRKHNDKLDDNASPSGVAKPTVTNNPNNTNNPGETVEAHEYDPHLDGILEAVNAFRHTGRPTADLKKEALQIREHFVLGGRLLGIFIGLVFGAKLLSLALAKSRTIYEPHSGNCVSCGRCYKFCPKELARVKKLTRKPAPAPVKPA